MGAPEYACEVSGEQLTPVLQELTGRLGSNFDPLTRWIGNLESVKSADSIHTQQKWWTEALGKRSLTLLLDTVSTRDQARLLEQQTGIGSAFMATTPSTALHTSIQSDLYRLGLKWWLGMPLIEQSDRLPICTG